MPNFAYNFFKTLIASCLPIYEWIKTNINSITSSLFSTIVYISAATLLLLLVTKVRKYYNPYKRILRFSTRKTSIDICYAMIPNTIRNRRVFLLEEGDVTALYNLYDILSDVYGREKLVVLNHHDIQSNLARISHFISISGPLYNKVTEQYIGHSGSPVIFSKETKGLILINNHTLLNNGNVFDSTYNDNGVVKTCHGILLSGLHTTSSGTKQSYFLCAGNSSMSTYTAILILRRICLDRSFRKVMKRNGIQFHNKWCILFKVSNLSEREVWSMSTPIKDSSLNYEIMKYFSGKDFIDPYEYHYR